MKDRKGGVDFGEMIWWFLFANGGLVLAFLVPAHILFQGILSPLGLVHTVSDRYLTFAKALDNPIVKVYLLVLIAAPMYHWAHRFRTVIGHMGFVWGRRFHPLVVYGMAVLVTVLAGYILLAAP